MICFLALIVFGIIGIFSATHRQIAFEAFDCVFRKVTLRKCNSALDQRLKSQITGSFFRFSPKLAGIIYKRFELISWFFTVITILSIVSLAWSGFNFATTGNCDYVVCKFGENHITFGTTTLLKIGECKSSDTSGLCIFDPFGEHEKDPTGQACSVANSPDKVLYRPDVTDEYRIGPSDSKVSLIEFGCYQCENTKNAEEDLQKILKEYEGRIEFIYKNLPLTQHENSRLSHEAALCAGIQGKFWEYRAKLLANEKEVSNDLLNSFAVEVGVDKETFTQCLTNGDTKNMVQKDFEDGIQSRIYGTPTFFVNDKAFVGMDYDKLKALIEEELK